jgi:AcrR family transcriptional regulator
MLGSLVEKKPESAPLTRLRTRTRGLLIDAALELFGDRCMRVPAIHEIAARAGVATGTFYNYFRTREELLEAAIVEGAERLQNDIVSSYAAVADPAERVAIGTRRFILQAKSEPMWAGGLLRVWGSTPDVLSPMLAPVLASLRAGRRRRRFTYRNEDAAADLAVGTVAAATVRVVAQRADEESATLIAALILRGLGVRAAEADEIASRPLPSRSDGKARKTRIARSPTEKQR